MADDLNVTREGDTLVIRIPIPRCGLPSASFSSAAVRSAFGGPRARRGARAGLAHAEALA